MKEVIVSYMECKRCGQKGCQMEKNRRQEVISDKLERPIKVRNVDGTNNSGGAITHQVEVNVYYKGHVERMRIDICDLGKIEVILGMP